jgi:TonB family protein
MHRAILTSLILVALAPAARAQLEQQPTDFAGDEEKKDEPPKAAPQLTKAPELLQGMDAPYPEAAKAEGRQGEVVLRITIDAAGRVALVEVLGSAGADLDWSAMGAVTNFVFSPAEIDGKPAPVAVEYRTVFELAEVVEEVPIEEPEEEFFEDELEEKPRGPRNLDGIVREAATKIPLEGVDVVVELAGSFDNPADGLVSAQSDEEGRFAFYGLPPGEHRITLAYSGYEPHFVVETIEPKQRTEVIVYLVPSQGNAFETVIRERRAKKEVSKIALTREEVRRVPGTFGDPLRVIENLPGLARAPFVGGALIVRGANPQDSGVYFDGVDIPLLYHFGGLTSVVNAEFLEDINFYPGGFGSYYGRATAGIVDVTSRRLNLANYRGYAEVDLLDSGFFFGGPVKVGDLPTVTFAAAARRSYIDALLPIALDIIIGPDGQGVVATPVYWDYQVKAEVSPLPGNHFSLFAFGSDDDVKVIVRGAGPNAPSINLGFKTTWHRLVGRWETRLPGGIRHFAQPYLGVNLANAELSSDLGLGVEFGVDSYTWGLRDELRWAPVEEFEAAVGVDYIGTTFGAEINIPTPFTEIGEFPRVFPRIVGTNQTIESSGLLNAGGFYSEMILRPFKFLQIVPGVRAESVLLTNFPAELPDGTETDGSNVWLWNLDPRVTARLDVTRSTTLKGAFGVYRQPPDGQAVSAESGNPAALQPRALQYIIGIEQGLTDDINLDLQAYYTARDLLIQSTSEIIAKGGGEFDPIGFTNGGRGRTFGVEALLRHELTKYFYGWIAYTLSRSEIDLDENDEEFELTDFDQTHILTVVGQVNLPWEFTLGARFRAVTGSPSSKPVGSVHDLDTTNYGRISSPAGSVRLPWFHQLDIRVDRKWIFDSFSFTTYLDLLNVYNQPNAEGFQEDFRSRRQEPIPGLPILPVIGASGEF